MTDLERQFAGYRLTTAEITYHRPEYPDLLQNYIWQEYDIAPRFPVLRRFITFWKENLEGRLHSITVASTELIRPAEIRAVGWSHSLH